MNKSDMLLYELYEVMEDYELYGTTELAHMIGHDTSSTQYALNAKKNTKIVYIKDKKKWMRTPQIEMFAFLDGDEMDDIQNAITNKDELALLKLLRQAEDIARGYNRLVMLLTFHYQQAASQHRFK